MSKLKKLIFGILGIVIAGMLGAYILAGWNEVPLNDEARANAPGSFLETSQGKIHYRWFGEQGAPVIVMAHGFSTPNFIYEQNANALAAAGFRVLTFDHLGRGWSDRPRTKYDDAFYERELLDVINGLALEDPIGLTGLSMGGLTTTYFAGRHPDRVSALFLFVPTGFDNARDPDNASSKVLMTPLLGDWVWRVFGKKILLSNAQYDESDLKPGSRLQGDVIEQIKYKGYFQALLSSFRHMQMSNREDVFQRLQTTDIPVMALFGSEDTTVLPSSFDKFNKALPKAKGVLIEGGEHGLNYQMPSQSNAHLIEFFQTHMQN